MDLHGILVVDKPRGITSHDVVGQVRRLLRTKRVGHAGTLDPAAEGILVVAVGRATRLVELLQQTPKQYLAHVVLGAGSISGDVEGPLMVASADAPRPALEQVARVIDSFMGETEQTPPAHSAVKIGGKPAYRAAQKGQAVEIPSRRVVISRLQILSYDYPDLFVLVDCAPGTYIRSLASDIGKSLQSNAYLHYLLRTKSGRFSLADAWPMSSLHQGLSPSTFGLMALHPDAGLKDPASLLLGSAQKRAWYYGQPVHLSGDPNSGDDVGSIYDSEGEWLGLAARERSDEIWHPRLVIPRSSDKDNR